MKNVRVISITDGTDDKTIIDVIVPEKTRIGFMGRNNIKSFIRAVPANKQLNFCQECETLTQIARGQDQQDCPECQSRL